MDRSAQHAPLELDELSPQVRTVFESIIETGEVELVQAGEPVGTLSFRSAIHEGVIHPPAVETGPEPAADRETVTVVATTMRMSEAARTRLSDALGDSYVVLDFADAPKTVDVLLTHAVSHQLINRWTLMFPQARILVTEILDEELGLDVQGPVGRLLDAGAHAYLPRRPVEQLAQNVHGYLAAEAHRELGAWDGTVLEIGPADEV